MLRLIISTLSRMGTTPTACPRAEHRSERRRRSSRLALPRTHALGPSLLRRHADHRERHRAGRRDPDDDRDARLYNGDTGGSGLALDVDWLNVSLGSGTPAAGMTVFGAVFKPTNPPSANPTGYGSASCSGSARGTKALWGRGSPRPRARIGARSCRPFRPPRRTSARATTISTSAGASSCRRATRSAWASSRERARRRSTS
jgi:hypothetical protein